jgi:predicted DNA-binding transcriptional regulator YafY
MTSSVRRDWLDLFTRMNAAHLVDEDGSGEGDAEWVVVRLRFAAVMAARTLLSYGANVEVVSPPEVRADLAQVAAEVVAQYGIEHAFGRLPG